MGLVWRLNILGLNETELLAKAGSDDLFYYTQVAHFWATTGQPSFDGMFVTTGFQPLFALILIPFASSFPGELLIALRCNLGLITVLTLVLAWSFPFAMSNLFGKTEGRWVGALLGSVWLLHPELLRITFSGTEAVLAALAWLWSLSLWWRAKTDVRSQVVLGIALGIGTLARIDHVFLGVAFMVWSYPKGWKACWALASGWIFTMLPWVLFCWWLTGSAVQDSGVAKRFQYQGVHHQAIETLQTQHSHWQPTRAQATYWLKRAQALPQPLLQINGRFSKTTCFFLLILASAWLFFARQDSCLRRKARDFLCKNLPVGVAVVGLLGFYLVNFGYLRSWYYLPAHLAGSVVVVVGWVWLWQRLPRFGRGIMVIGTVFAGLGMAIEDLHQKPFRWEPYYVAAGLDLQARTPPNARIGAFNAGIQGAISREGRKIVNLDGVVNHEALEALRLGHLLGFIQEAKIDYLIDHRSAPAFYQTLGAPNLEDHLKLIATYSVPERPAEAICLWQIVDNTVQNP